MNNALKLEITRRRSGGKPTGDDSEDLQRKEKSDNEAAVLDLSDPHAVAAVTATTDTVPTIRVNEAADKSMERNEKRSSIISVVSALFSSSKQTSVERRRISTSRDDLISKAVSEVTEGDDDQEEECETQNIEDMAGNDEDVAAREAREAKNAERIELDFGSGNMDLGDFRF